MTTGKRIGRRALGTTLALLILLSCTFAAAPGIAGTLLAAAAGSVTFVVPETIYLTPTNDTAGSKTMQYYLNVNADGTVPQGFSGTGNVRFSNAAANSVRITCSDSSVTLSTSSGTNEINATIGGQLSSGLASGQTRTLTWTAQYTENGQTKTVRSFSVVYAPFANPVGAIAGAVADKGSSVYASCSTLIYGVQQVVNSYMMNDTFLATQPEPFYYYGEPNGTSRISGTGVYRYSLASSGVTPPVYDGYGVPDSLLTNISTSLGSSSQSGVAFGYASGLDMTQRVLVFGGTGRVYYDTSRVTKIGQIPNISIRSFLNGAGCTGSFSNSSDDFHARALYLTADSSVSNSNASYSTTTYWSNTYDREDVYTIPTNGDFCNYALSGGVKSLVSVVNRFWRAVPAVFGGNASSKTDATAAAACEFYGIDKSAARTRYLNEVSAARQCGADAAAWNNYQAQMQAVAEYLGTPTATSVDLNALNNAVSALVQSQRTTLTVDPNGGKWQNNSTAVRTYTQNDGSTFTLSETPSRDGYTFDGWELVSGGGTLNGSVYTFGAANGTVRAKWTGTPILTLDLNGGYWTDNHSTENRTVQKTGDIPYTLPDNPKRDGYVFSGWLMENGNISGGVYRFGDADETLTAQWFEYTNTFIEFGSYPQTKVTDETLLTALNAAPQVWRSYGYYVGLGNGDADGRIFESNSMQYCDVTYNGQKYRGVKFSQYRPYYTNVPSSATYSMQDENGYAPNTTYWFRWEPLTWRVLDPDTGLVLCEPIIDSQAYNNLVFYDSETDRRYGDTAKTYYASNYEHSNLRAWLTDATLSTSFLNTAFTSAQSGAILETTLDNRALREDYAEYDSASTTDKIFLLSYEDVLNQSYGFPSVNIQSDERKAPATDYAKCQGIGRSISTEYFPWRLRTPDMNSWQVTLVNFDGGRMGFGGYRADSTDIGVRPAMRLDLNAAATLADAATLTIHPNGGIWSDHSTAPKTITQNAGSTYTIPETPQRDGLTFAGWQFSGTGGMLNGNVFTFGTDDCTVYAKWARRSTLTIDTNGGIWSDHSTAPRTVMQTEGSTYTLSEVPKRDGFRFIGWQLSGSGGSLNGTVYTFGASNGVVYARWAKLPQDKLSVTIGDQIGVNLLLDLDARPDAQSVTVTYKDLSGNEQTETFTDFASLPQVEGGLYKIAVQIAPAQIADSVTVYIDGETLDACVKDYCNTLSEGEYEPEVAALAQAVLDYGQAANNYFDYSDETLSALADLSADDARAWQSKFSDTTGKIQNVSFMALTKPEFRFYMKNMTEAEAAAFNSAGITAVYEDSNITEPLRARFVRNTNGSILLEVTGVLAERMDQKIIVTIPGLGTITFAGNDFARMMAMSENGAIETLGAALYAYGEAAKNCFVGS